MHTALNNARHPKETQPNYRARRRLVAKKLKQVLRGTFAHVSSRIVKVEVPYTDEALKGIERGDIRDLTPEFTGPDGKSFRFARTKGETFAYPSAEQPAHSRKVRRAIARMFS